MSVILIHDRLNVSVNFAKNEIHYNFICWQMRRRLNAQRTEDYRNGTYALAGGVVDPLPEDAPQFVKDYYAYYKTSRGYHKRSLNSNGDGT